MRVYLAGPYSDPDPEKVAENVAMAQEAWVHLWANGHNPFCPHLSHYLALTAGRLGITIEYEDWMAWDLSWLAKCDAFVCLADSPGADREVRFAEQMDIPAFDSVGALLDDEPSTPRRSVRFK